MSKIIICVQGGKVHLTPQANLHDLALCDFALHVRKHSFDVIKDRYGMNNKNISSNEAFTRVRDHVLVFAGEMTRAKYLATWSRNEKED